MYRTIVVPLDGSNFGRHAIPWALAIAAPAGAQVQLLHVLVPPYGMGAVDGTLITPDVANAQRAAVEARQRELAERLTTGTGVRFTASVVEGDTADAITEYASAHAADLIVMTTHGRGGFARALLGSVSDAVARRSDHPVLLVRPREHDPEEHEPAAVSDVLVLLDGTPTSETILEPAVELCALLGAACTLFHVVVARTLLTGVTAPDALADPEAAAADERKAQDYLAGHAERFRARSVPITTGVLRGADVVAGVLDHCASHPVSLIAMTTRGRGGAERAALGSAMSDLLHRTRLPMLVAAPRGAPAPR